MKYGVAGWTAVLASVALGAILSTGSIAWASEQVLKNDSWTPGAYVDPMGVAAICFPDETFSAEFQADPSWYPYTIKRVETVFVASPMDLLLGSSGTPCGQFRLAIWRGSGTANPGEPMWDSKAKVNKVWDIKGDGQVTTIDLEKDGAVPPPITTGPGGNTRLRIGLRADSLGCANGVGNGSFPSMSPDGQTPKATFNWGYGWALNGGGLEGCAGGKSGNAFWVTSEQFGIKGNFVLRLIIDTADNVSTPDAGSTGDSGLDPSPDNGLDPGSSDAESDTGAGTSVDTGADPADLGTTADTGKVGADASIGKDFTSLGGPLALTAVAPACIAPLVADTEITLTGSGFTADMVVTINDVPMEVESSGLTPSSAKVFVKKGSLGVGAWTVRAENGAGTALLVGSKGLHVGSCGSGSGTPASGCSSTRNTSGWSGFSLLLIAAAWLLARRRPHLG